jgi:DNA-binding NarL/FixJ family response regulator
MTTVLIATADAALCSALKLILRQRLAVAVVGESATGVDLEASLVQLQPDLLLLDWALPEFQELIRLSYYQLLAPRAQIVALRVGVEETTGVLSAGAHACLPSGASPENLIAMLRQYA